MVDTGTFNRLSADEQNEYQRYSSRFIKAVLKSDAIDGLDFQNKYQLHSDGEYYYLASSGTAQPFAGIKSKFKGAIEALLSDAVQNYGR
jgi:hypothetical protein